MTENMGQLIDSEETRTKFISLNVIVLSSDGESANREEGAVGSVTAPTSLEAASDSFAPVKVKARLSAIVTLFSLPPLF